MNNAKSRQVPDIFYIKIHMRNMATLAVATPAHFLLINRSLIKGISMPTK